jgi:hypothetical protein
MPVESHDEKVTSMPEQHTNQAQTSKRKAVLSPELSEVLHMLKSLETGPASKPSSAR